MNVPEAERCRAWVAEERDGRVRWRQCSRRGYPVERLNGTILLCKQHQRSKTRSSSWRSDRAVKISEKVLQDGVRLHLAQVQGLRSYAFAAVGTHGPLHGVVPTGFPDTVVIVPESRRRTVQNPYSAWRAVGPLHAYFEMKTGRGSVKPEQERMHEELRELGCCVEVIQSDDIDDAIRQVERVLADEGVLLREWS